MRPANVFNSIRLRCMLGAIIFWLIALLALRQGIKFRQWLYPASASFRSIGDISNAWQQGEAVLKDAKQIGDPQNWRIFLRAYRDRYDVQMAEHPEGNYTLDYPPARLLIMSLWVRHMTAVLPAPLPAPPDLASPLLAFNTTCELIAAIFTFLIVRQVLHRGQIAQANWRALVAALLLWFNPAIFLDRIWLQWDAWALPFYLGAAYFAFTRRWLIAGIVLGIGAMFKGQILCTAGIFVLWPLFQFRLRAARDVLIGTFFSAMLCVSPWMLRTLSAWIFFCILLFLIGTVIYFAPRRWRKLLVFSSLPLTLFLAGFFFHGSFGWWFVSFAYSTHHYQVPAIGHANNLGALLAIRGNWNLHDVLFSTWPHLDVTVRGLLVTIYILTFVSCAIALARHDLRNDRKALLALAAPWVLMFAFMPQMHERYLFWGAAITALAAGVSLGATLLHLLITFLACLSIGVTISDRQPLPALGRFLRNSHPDAAWAVLVAALVLLYLALTPSRTKFRRCESYCEEASPPSSAPPLPAPASDAPPSV